MDEFQKCRAAGLRAATIFFANVKELSVSDVIEVADIFAEYVYAGEDSSGDNEESGGELRVR